MKTTIEIADSLLTEAKKVAADQNSTLRALVEEGLRIVLGHRRRRRKKFRFDPVTFKGRGLQSGLGPSGWDEILDLSYRGRGS